MKVSRRLSQLRVLPLAGNKARGWLTAGPFRMPCALGPAGIVRIKREGDKGTPAGRFRLLWGYYRPDRVRLRAAGAPLRPLGRDQGWCEDPASPRYNRPVRLPARDCTDRMWREDHLYDLTFVLDQNFSRRKWLYADRRLRRDFRRRHEETRSAPRARRRHSDWVATPLRSADTESTPSGSISYDRFDHVMRTTL